MSSLRYYVEGFGLLSGILHWLEARIHTLEHLSLSQLKFYVDLVGPQYALRHWFKGWLQALKDLARLEELSMEQRLMEQKTNDIQVEEGRRSRENKR